MRHLESSLIVIIVVAGMMVGCGSKNTLSNGADSTLPTNQNVGNSSQDAVAYLSGYGGSATTAIMKKSSERYSLEDGSSIYWMQLENNSKDNIFITGTRVIVNNYKPLEPESYVLFRVGDGETFDPYIGLYSMIGKTIGSYDGYKVDLDENGWIIKDSIDWDPVMRQEVAGSDGINIIYQVAYKDPGIYDYTIVVDYEYNGNMYHATRDYKILYDNDDDAMMRAEEEFYENEEYYLDMVF